MLGLKVLGSRMRVFTHFRDYDFGVWGLVLGFGVHGFLGMSIGPAKSSSGASGK